MLVEAMHGTFQDFLIPGIVLFGLGVLDVVYFLNTAKQKDGLDLAALANADHLVSGWNSDSGETAPAAR